MAGTGAMNNQQAAAFYAGFGLPPASGSSPALQPAQAPNAPDGSYYASPSTQALVNALYKGILPVSQAPIMPGGDNYNDPGDTGGTGTDQVPSSIAGDNAIVNGPGYYAQPQQAQGYAANGSIVPNKDQSQLAPQGQQAFAYASQQPSAPLFKNWSDYIQPGAVQAATQVAQAAVPGTGRMPLAKPAGLGRLLGGLASTALGGLGGLASTAEAQAKKVAAPIQMLQSMSPQLLGALGLVPMAPKPVNTAQGLASIGLSPQQAQTYLAGGAAQQATNPVPLVAALTGALNKPSGSIAAPSSGNNIISPFHSTS